MKDGMLQIGYFPLIQRDLFLARCFKREKDLPKEIGTLKVSWGDMDIIFASTEAVSSASVEVKENISLSLLSRRLESLLDCGGKGQSEEWVLKYNTSLHQYGSPAELAGDLCDKVSSVSSETGEIIGVMKIKRRAVSRGHAKIRIAPEEDLVQIVCRHTTAQGLKAVWKSVLWRISPQHGKRTSGLYIVCRPRDVYNRSDHQDAVRLVKKFGHLDGKKNFNSYWQQYIPVTVERLAVLYRERIRQLEGVRFRNCYFLYREKYPEKRNIENSDLEDFLLTLQEEGVKGTEGVRI